MPREVGIERDIEKAALVLGVDLGHASHGLLAQPAASIRRRRPGFSVTSMSPSGRKAKPHGSSRPPATSVTRKVAASVLTGPSGRVAWAQVALARAARRVVAGRRILDLPDKLGRYGRSCFSPTRGQPGQPGRRAGRRVHPLCGKSLKVRQPFCSRERTSVFQAQHDLGCQETWTRAPPTTRPAVLREIRP